MENKNNTDRFVKITQSKEEMETNGKKAIACNYKLQVENMNVLEMFNASIYLLEFIIKRFKIRGHVFDGGFVCCFDCV